MNTEGSVLNKSTIILLQEFWGLSKLKATELFTQTSLSLDSILRKQQKGSNGDHFLNKLKVHIKERLLPPSLNVEVLNQGEINSLIYAGKKILEYVKKTTHKNESLQIKQLSSVNFITAILLAQSDYDIATLPSHSIAVPDPKQFSSLSPIEDTGSIEQTTKISFGKISLWIFVGFLILFILCFLLLKLFS